MDVEVADTVGAGDAFTAAMTLGLLAACNVQAGVNEALCSVFRPNWLSILVAV
jgi:sugar/nucleoside kinase (ribokinase family)